MFFFYLIYLPNVCWGFLKSVFKSCTDVNYYHLCWHGKVLNWSEVDLVMEIRWKASQQPLTEAEDK